MNVQIEHKPYDSSVKRVYIDGNAYEMSADYAAIFVVLSSLCNVITDIENHLKEMHNVEEIS